MRVLRDRQGCISATQPDPSTTQHSLISTVGALSDEWEIQFLILVSFGLQVLLFFAAGVRRRSTSSILRSLLWLAYLTADSVAIFVLGHLAVHANGPQHQLLFFWAPFVLLHLGGQDTMTAFSMQDNELWKRHVLGLVTQVAVAGYVVSRTSWPDRRLLAAMVLMFLSGCFKYGERTFNLYRASPKCFRESSLALFHTYEENFGIYGTSSSLDERLKEMVADGRRHSSQTLEEASSSAVALVSDIPINDVVTIGTSHQYIKSLLQGMKSNKDRCRVYNYVSTRLVLIYEILYTKALLRYFSIKRIKDYIACIAVSPFGILNFFLFLPCVISLLLLFLSTVFLLFPLAATLLALLLFVVVEKGQLYSPADVTVSYILLIGATILEVASLFITILSNVCYMDTYQCARKQWSEMLGQYNMIKILTGQDTKGLMAFVPQWITKHVDDKKLTHIPISEDFKKFVLDKLLDFGTREQDWNFASFRGQLALQKWMDSHKDCSTTSPITRLLKSLHDVDLPTSVLIWHIATDIIYFRENTGANSDQQMKEISRELSNYIMYLVFKCGVLLTSSTEFVHNKALQEMEGFLKKHVSVSEKEAIMMLYEANIQGHLTSSSSQRVTQIQLREDAPNPVVHPLMPRVCEVAGDLILIHRESYCWDLIASVWIEKLYYIAPRCGGAFHSKHLVNGGEFITHVLLLMRLLGPFLPPPSA